MSHHDEEENNEGTYHAQTIGNLHFMVSGIGDFYLEKLSLLKSQLLYHFITNHATLRVETEDEETMYIIDFGSDEIETDRGNWLVECGFLKKDEETDQYNAIETWSINKDRIEQAKVVQTILSFETLLDPVSEATYEFCIENTSLIKSYMLICGIDSEDSTTPDDINEQKLL